MNQYFYDELKCASNAISAKKFNPGVYAGDEINIIGDEHSLSAYLAGFFMLTAKNNSSGKVNIIAEGEVRNQNLFSEVISEFKDGPEFTVYKNIEDYLIGASEIVNKHFFYIANLQLPEYNDKAFADKKKENLEKWLKIARDCGGSFLFIPIFNFAGPFESGIVSVSEREIEAVAEHDASFISGKILMEMEEICRKSFKEKSTSMNVVRFDNIFGPLVEDTTKLGIDSIIDDLAYNNKITFRKSDGLTHYTGCYIRQAVTAVFLVGLIGKNGNIYNAANYSFTVHDIKNDLYKCFSHRNPDVLFEDDILSGWTIEKNYECLANLKIKSLGWTEETPLREAFYRTALIKINEEYKGDFYVDIYQGKLERVKRIEMNIMREIDRICRENDIGYFLVGGSLLGAIRHKGFIPWDDDIDIGMLREDFEKFRRICPQLLASHLSYQSYTDEPTSHYIFDKVRLKDTYFSTRFSNRFNNIENGIFIDILVYDKTANSEIFQKVHIKSIQFFRRLINIRWVGKARKGIHYTASKIMLPIMKRIPFFTYHQFFERALQMFDFKKNSKYLIDGVGQNLEKGPFPKSWFEELIDVPYEDMVFKAPKAYDEYLRHWYGDRYMELLPLSSRNSGHALARLDLGKYLYEHSENYPTRDANLTGEIYEKPVYDTADMGMNESFLDEISLIDKEIKMDKLKYGALNKCEINIICDEHTLAAYLAGYYMYRNKSGKTDGCVNVILEGKCRNRDLYDQIAEEFDANALFNIYESVDSYYGSVKSNAKKVYYYIANFHLPEYGNIEFIKAKKRNLRKWLALSRNTNGRFVFIPIFNFAKPFDGDLAAVSEREIETLVLHEKNFYQGRLLMEFEDILRKSFSYSKNKLNVVRFDNIFGPFVKDTSKLGIDNIVSKLVNENIITFNKSDSVIHYSGCYIRQAVTAVHCVAMKGRKGNIYNAANYNFTLHDIKSTLYDAFIERNPKIEFVGDIKAVPQKVFYERMGNLKLRDIGWKSETPLQEALNRTLYAELDICEDDKISQELYQGKLEKIRRLQIDIVKDVDRICKNNGIKYFLVGGSLLGAIKYGGYIPWEDTIDIGFFREDYEKFKEVCPGELSDRLKYQTYKQGSVANTFYDRIRLNDTGFFSAANNKSKLVDNGLFINIFVYDKTSNTTIGKKIHLSTIQNLRRLINIRWQNTALPGKFRKFSRIILPVIRMVPVNVYHKALNSTLKKYRKQEDHVFLIDGQGMNIAKGAFPEKWFYSLIDVEFEGLKLPAPSYYDKYLKHFYGENYMRVIPESKRDSGRKVMRIDLGKYLYEETAQKKAHIKNAKGELFEKTLED